MQAVIRRNNDNKTFIAAILALVLSLGIGGTATYQQVFDNELSDYYVCTITEEIMEFKGGVSSTKYTGYPFENSRSGRKYCTDGTSKGEWIKISEYAEMKGIDPYDYIMSTTTTTTLKSNSNQAKYRCNQKGCVEII